MSSTAAIPRTQDHERFEALLREHRKIVFKVAAIYARGPEDRRDLVQEISTQLWRSFHRYDERRGKFSTWMYRVALTVAISQARREPWAEANRLETLDDRHLDTIAGEAEATEDERLEALYAFIGQLDAPNRALILLYL